jgi:hypothetical protein
MGAKLLGVLSISRGILGVLAVGHHSVPLLRSRAGKQKLPLVGGQHREGILDERTLLAQLAPLVELLLRQREVHHVALAGEHRDHGDLDHASDYSDPVEGLKGESKKIQNGRKCL